MNFFKFFNYLLILSIIFFIFFTFLFYYMNNSYLVLEIVPIDQNKVPIPSIGDEIEVYGVYVEDVHNIGFISFSWFEIHPVRYIKILNKNIEGGENPYKGDLMEGVLGPGRLRIVDINNPYRYVKGIVRDVFINPIDGDVHLRLEVYHEYYDLIKFKPLLPYISVRVLLYLSLIFGILFVTSLVIIFLRFFMKYFNV